MSETPPWPLPLPSPTLPLAPLPPPPQLPPKPDKIIALKCPICDKFYDRSMRTIRGHVFCLHCIVRGKCLLIERKRTYEVNLEDCPICRKKMSGKGSPEAAVRRRESWFAVCRRKPLFARAGKATIGHFKAMILSGFDWSWGGGGRGARVRVGSGSGSDDGGVSDMVTKGKK
ncbi:hypothetical protein L1887_02870 [Cichorium endivia]|nr:hypothetical protein L1887_02870 [Cichorium endivia]